MQVLITLRWTKSHQLYWAMKISHQIDTHGNHNHVGIGTTTTTGSALSVANGKFIESK